MTGAVPPAPPGDDRDTAAELLGGFPRHATRDLVEAEEHQRRARVPLAGLALAAGATLIALGLPSERLFGPGPALVDASARGALADLRALYLPLAQLVDALPRLTAERTAYLMSGLAFGALAWVVWRIGAARESSPHARVVAVVLALCAPAVWIAGRHPGPEALATVFGAACFGVLARPRSQPGSRPGANRDSKRGTSRGRAAIAGALWLAAASCSPAWVCALPAVALGAVGGATRGSANGARARSAGLARTFAAIRVALFLALAALAWVGGIGLVHWIDGAPLWAFRDAGFDALRALVGEDAGPTPARLGLAIGAIGPLWIGVLGLVARDERGDRAPAWVVAWLASSIAAALCVPLDAELAPAIALPPLALGALRLFTARPAWSTRAATIALIACSALAAGGATAWWNAGDPDAAWRAVLEREARRGDVLLTTSWSRDYLARRRYGLRAFEVGQTARLSRGYRAEEREILERRLARVRKAGARLVLDRRPGTDDPRLAAFVLDLREGLAIDALPYPAAP